MPGEIEQSRVKADVIADALEHDALQVVVEQGPRNAPECGERLDMAAHEALQRLVEREAREDRARPRQNHHEARERALR